MLNQTASAQVPRTTALVAALVPLLFLVGFAGLTKVADYPAVLDRPMAEVLQSVATQSSLATYLWSSVMFASVLQIVLSLLLAEQLAPSPWRTLSTWFGVLAGLAQFLDLSQWVYLVPNLANAYAHAQADATRTSIELIYQAFQDYLGVAIGRYFATVASGVWALGLGLLMMKQGLGRVLGGLGALSGGLFLLSIFAPLGFAFWAVTNTLGFGVWVVWLLWLSWTLLRRRPDALSSARSAPRS